MKNIILTLLAATILISMNTFGQVITVDGYYNHETQKDSSGKWIDYHYLWNDQQMTGFSIFGEAFKKNGAKVLDVLSEQPTLKNLSKSEVYIIVDPDNLKDNKHPNFMNAADAKTIANWVKNGGVLFLLANDKVNCDLEHFNILAEKFGFKFNNDLILHVTDDDHFADGALSTSNSSIFETSRRIFIKDASSISIQHSAKSLLKTANGENVLVSAKYGKGIVLAVGDPWLYNEYTNGRLPAEFENDKAANDIASFLIKRISKK